MNFERVRSRPTASSAFTAATPLAMETALNPVMVSSGLYFRMMSFHFVIFGPSTLSTNACST